MQLTAPGPLAGVRVSRSPTTAKPALTLSPVRHATRSSYKGLRWANAALPEPAEQVAVAAVVPPEEDLDETAPYFEPALRAFALGIASGVVFELLHVATTLTGFATSAGVQLSALLPAAWEELAPMIALDNMAAICSAAVFYGIEVAAILSVFRQYPNDTRKAARAITRMPTLPKRLLPVKLSSVKRALYALIALRNPAAALNLSGFSSVFRGSASTSNALGAKDIPTTTTSAFVDGSRSAGTAVLERPPTTTSAPAPPGLGAPGAPLPPWPGTTLLPPATREGKQVTEEKKNKREGVDGRAPRPVPQPKGKRTGLPPGAWDRESTLPATKTSRREKELTERKGYLKNFWYAAALSQNLKDSPLEVELLGRKVVLFRDAETGKPRCLDNLCPHRGAPLGRGWVKEVEVVKEEGGPAAEASTHTCVVCPYHGWAFSGEGKLREVPSQPDQRHLPRRPLIDVYPVEERGGFIWLFFGSSSMPAEERPPIPWTPELNDPKWQPVYGEMEFDAPHWSVFDNALDMAHIHYLHSDSFGNSSKPEIMGMSSERDTFSIGGSFKIHNKPVNALWEWTAVEAVPVTYKAMLPSSSSIKITLGAGVQMITFVNTVPISATRSVNRFCLIRNFAAWEGFDEWARRAMFKILSEDKVMVEQLHPEGVPVEVSLEADKPQIAFRHLRKEWADMGYVVPPEATQGHNGSLDM